jgi:transcriptional regulator with XRE-family HTH domain
MKAITKRLRVLRAQANLNQRITAERAGMTLLRYHEIEKGYRSPDQDDVEAIAKALRVTPADILPTETVQANG